MVAFIGAMTQEATPTVMPSLFQVTVNHVSIHSCGRTLVGTHIWMSYWT